jgi:hypothetical protein
MRAKQFERAVAEADRIGESRQGVRQFEDV